MMPEKPARTWEPSSWARCGASANKIRVGRWRLLAFLNYIKDVLGLYAKMLKVCRTIVLPKKLLHELLKVLTPE